MEYWQKTYVPISKECKRCKEQRHWELFRRCSSNEDGLDDICKICDKEELDGIKCTAP
jgi:hypothetical protein